MEFVTEHTKSVSVTLGTNIQTYKSIKQFLEEETDDEYAAIYSNIASQLEDYFILASEDMLCNYYTDYLEFRDSYIEKKRAQNKSKKKAQ